jgi:hypothetical protein
MNTGMLWFDNDPHTALTIKVNRASEYFRKKYGLVPNLCLVNPCMLDDQDQGNGKQACSLAIQPHRAILPGHLWIGNDEKNQAP